MMDEEGALRLVRFTAGRAADASDGRASAVPGRIVYRRRPRDEAFGCLSQGTYLDVTLKARAPAFRPQAPHLRLLPGGKA